jgi:predicted nucleic acid-binding protein
MSLLRGCDRGVVVRFNCYRSLIQDNLTYTYQYLSYWNIPKFLRELPNIYLNRNEVDDLINFYCAVGVPHEIFFLWRPFLRDPKDEMVLELTVKVGCESIITYNTRDFAGVEQFGLKLLKPSEFLRLIGKLP